MSKITFKELAKISEVSIGTLSRYFNDGYVSDEKKKIISSNIKKYNFLKNDNAGSIKKKKNMLIVIRTLVSSKTQDVIIEGIIKYSKDENVVVKYSGINEEMVIKSMRWAAAQNPRALVVFSPKNPSKNFNNELVNLKSHLKVITYNFENEIVSNVSADYKDAYKKLKKELSEIFFVSTDIIDNNSYRKRVKILKEFFKVNIVDKNNIPKTGYLYFQVDSSRIEYTESNILNKNKFIIPSYKKPILGNKDAKWIFIDNLLIGIHLYKLTIVKDIDNIIVKAKLANYK